MSTERPVTNAENGGLHGSSHWADSVSPQINKEISNEIDFWDLSTTFAPGSIHFNPSTTLHAEGVEGFDIQPEFSVGLDAIPLYLPRGWENSTIGNHPALISTSADVNFESMMPPETSQRDGIVVPPVMSGDSTIPPSPVNSDIEVPLANANEQGSSVEMAIPTTQPPDQAQTFHCSFQGCESSSFSSQSLLRKHVALKHTRPHVCSLCDRGFSTTKDYSRHMRTVHATDLPSSSSGAWKCDEVNCRRKGKPFSRRDNYLKHLREVHGKERQGSKTNQGRRRSLEQGHKPSRGEEERTSPETVGACRNGKRKMDDLEDNILESSREDLFELLRQARRKCRQLEEEMQAQRRRYERREDTWLRLLDARSEDARE